MAVLDIFLILLLFYKANALMQNKFIKRISCSNLSPLISKNSLLVDYSKFKIVRLKTINNKKLTTVNLVDVDLGVALYDLELSVAKFLSPEQLASANGFTLLILYFAGLLTAFSPCTMGLLPLTLLYLGIQDNPSIRNTEGIDDNPVLEVSRMKIENAKLFKCFSYALGVATVFSILGLSASTIGTVFGSSNNDLR